MLKPIQLALIASLAGSPALAQIGGGSDLIDAEVLDCAMEHSLFHTMYIHYQVNVPTNLKELEEAKKRSDKIKDVLNARVGPEANQPPSYAQFLLERKRINSERASAALDQMTRREYFAEMEKRLKSAEDVCKRLR